jgi:CHAP domain
MPLAITTPKGFAYCPYGIEWFRRQGRLDMNPQVGDVVFYQFDQDAEADHVGIVESAAPGGITAIEGNTSARGSQSNGGAVMRADRKLSLVLGFGHPAYGMATTPTAPPASPLARPCPYRPAHLGVLAFRAGPDETWPSSRRRCGAPMCGCGRHGWSNEAGGNLWGVRSPSTASTADRARRCARASRRSEASRRMAWSAR